MSASLESSSPTATTALTSTERRRLQVIVNPNATTTNARLRSLVVHALDHRYEVGAVDTEAPGHATELARRAVADGVDAVVTLGGDGTVNEVANGLAGSGVPLVPLPGGATNVYHRLIGMPADLVDATEHVLALADRWQPRAVDLGRIGDRWFTFAAGIGLDADVVKRVDARPRLKARFGPWFFATVAVATFLRRYTVRPPRLVLERPADAPPLEGATAVFQNAREFTYFASSPVRLLHDVTLDSGRISGAVLRHTRPTIMPGVMLRALVPSLEVTGARAIDAAKDLTVATLRSADERTLPFQVDGDYAGQLSSAELGVGPGALQVVS
ncbi:diacylglycerol/lipid kinase family protein [Patulibacter defluvii]|uniref:diacylglycerol/lipid kinase family protein n=1 Tax=Patulibacter defluvii TaxID=3095358 RepID=UPI002A74AC13|nr:diacylglycerol kinase family protein [Patulibacter sp. DM4]